MQLAATHPWLVFFVSNKPLTLCSLGFDILECVLFDLLQLGDSTFWSIVWTMGENCFRCEMDFFFVEISTCAVSHHITFACSTFSACHHLYRLLVNMSDLLLFFIYIHKSQKLVLKRLEVQSRPCPLLELWVFGSLDISRCCCCWFFYCASTLDSFSHFSFIIQKWFDERIISHAEELLASLKLQTCTIGA